MPKVVFSGGQDGNFVYKILRTLGEAKMLAFVRSRRIADDQHTGVQVHDEQRSSRVRTLLRSSARLSFRFVDIRPSTVTVHKRHGSA